MKPDYNKLAEEAFNQWYKEVFKNKSPHEMGVAYINLEESFKAGYNANQPKVSYMEATVTCEDCSGSGHKCNTCKGTGKLQLNQKVSEHIREEAIKCVNRHDDEFSYDDSDKTIGEFSVDALISEGFIQDRVPEISEDKKHNNPPYGTGISFGHSGKI